MGWFTETKYVPYEKSVSVNKTVHNHLAPAAEHTKILKELKEEAQAEIIGSLFVNEIPCSGVVCYVDELERVIVCKIEIMGRLIEVEMTCWDISMLRRPYPFDGRQDVINELIEKVKEKLAEQIVFSFLEMTEIIRSR